VVAWSRATAAKECVVHLHYVRVVFGRANIDVGEGFEWLRGIMRLRGAVGVVYFGVPYASGVA
jgi:hypothetical protein